MANDNYRGARWLRTDLHLHTPASQPHFRLPAGVDFQSQATREDLVRRYVDRLALAGIKVGALTDYNLPRPEWYGPLIAAAEERGIFLYPGVELSLGNVGSGGLHVIAVFDRDVDLSSARLAIEKMHKYPSPLVGKDGIHVNIELEDDVVSALSKLRDELGCLLIMAHVDGDKGLMKTLKPAQAAEVILRLRPDALEGLTDDHRNLLVSTGKFSRASVDLLTAVEFSDPHTFEEIGGKDQHGRVRCTYLKLSAPGELGALRLALEDPEMRVRRGEPPRTTHPALVEMRVEGRGFLGGMEVEFSRELNALVGGRGVGKSATIETIRYALDLEPHVPTLERRELLRHALGSGGKVLVTLETGTDGLKGRRYRIERIWDEKPRIFDETLGRELDLSPAWFLSESDRPLVFGQREIYELTKDEAGGVRLRLLDDISGPPVQEKLRRMKEIEDQLRKNARAMQELEEKLSRQEVLEQELNGVRHKIEVFRERGVLEKLREAASLSREGQYLSELHRRVNEIRTDWADFQEHLNDLLSWVQSLAGKGKSKLGHLLERAVSEVGHLAKDLASAVSPLGGRLEEANTRLSEVTREWDVARRSLLEDLSLLKRELGMDVQGVDDLERLIAREAQLEQEIVRLENVRKKLTVEANHRSKLLNEVRELRYEIFRLRQARAEEINNMLGGRVHIEILYKGNSAEFQEAVKALISGSKIERSIIEKICSGEGVDGYQLARLIEEGPRALVDRFGISENWAKRVCDSFNERRERLRELEILFPDDTVEIKFAPDEAEAKPLNRLSRGQRATAILLILLSLGKRPLIIDQPEDDLDNRFIYEDVVRILRKLKLSKQIITATHNPNIPVLGDADLVLVLESEKREDRKAEVGRVTRSGSIDGAKIRESIKLVMEGGEQAFLRRAQKYGWPLGKGANDMMRVTERQ